MGTFNYDRTADTAKRLITKFGAVGQIRRSTSTFDPVAGEVVVDSYDETSGNMVTLPSNNFLVSFDETTDQQIAKMGRVFIIASKGLAFEPEVHDLIKFDGRVWEAIGSKPLNPSGTDILNIVGCIESGESWT